MKILLLIITAMTLMTLLDASPEPRRKSGGSRGSSSSSGGGFGSWFGGSKKKTAQNNGWDGYNNRNNHGSNNYGGNTYKKKGSGMSTLKKAAVIGAVAYGSYQIGKLSAGYSHWGWGQQNGYGFNDWNRWREMDGFLCRDSSDCQWIDPRLYCQDYQMDFRPSALWFGGDVARIIGECACPHGMYFDNYDMNCRQRFLSSPFALIGLAIAIGVVLCCCCGFLCVARKVMG